MFSFFVLCLYIVDLMFTTAVLQQQKATSFPPFQSVFKAQKASIDVRRGSLPDRCIKSTGHQSNTQVGNPLVQTLHKAFRVATTLLLLQHGMEKMLPMCHVKSLLNKIFFFPSAEPFPGVQKCRKQKNGTNDGASEKRSEKSGETRERGQEKDIRRSRVE